MVEEQCEVYEAGERCPHEAIGRADDHVFDRLGVRRLGTQVCTEHAEIASDLGYVIERFVVEFD